MDRVGTGGITRRSLIAGMAAAAANGARRPAAALAAQLAAGESTSTLAGLPLVSSGLQAGPGQPPIVARRAWAHDSAHPSVAPEYGTVQLAFVHHTENPDGYSAAEVPAMLRSIYVFHRYGRGWNDIGYNFVIDRFGRIFEARAGGIDEPVVGAQAGGYNAYSTGIALLGTYSAQAISPAAHSALERLLAWKLSLHGVPVRGHTTVRVTADGAVYSRYPANTPVTLPRVAGHRDADSTECPGNTLYGELSGVRHGAAQLAGAPARATLQLLSANAAGAASPLLVGSLRLLDGAPLASAPIEIQARSVSRRGETVIERVLAQAVTDTEGGWSLPVSISPAAATATALRAVSPGGTLPASVSEPLTIAGVVSFSVPDPAQAPAPNAPESQPPVA